MIKFPCELKKCNYAPLNLKLLIDLKCWSTSASDGTRPLQFIIAGIFSYTALKLPLVSTKYIQEL
jgi:hypothetical protein